MAPLIWFVLAVALLAVAWSGADLDALLAAALAALTLSLLTALMPLPALGPAVQLLLFSAASALLMLGLQRWSRRRAPAIPAGGSSDRASVISGFDAGQEGGRVRWQGQSWAATNLEPTRALAPGSAVMVMGRDGNRLQILEAAPATDR